MESPQIIFELQWKKKSGIAQIGVVLETTDEFLDFHTFKSYLVIHFLYLIMKIVKHFNIFFCY